MRFIVLFLACLALAFTNLDRAAADPRMADIVKASKLRIDGLRMAMLVLLRSLQLAQGRSGALGMVHR
jgi:hypothetical protein